MLSFFLRGVLDEILNLIESVSEGFPSYSFKRHRLQNHWTDLADILQEAYGAHPYKNSLNLSSWIVSVWVNLEK